MAKFWEDNKTYKTDLSKTDKKLYTLVMFIYPSGAKLHIGHWYNYGPTDSWARFKKLQGYNVFEPIGYDAFGLPAEGYAIKTGIHPQDSTLKNIDDIREQLKKMGCMYDWDAELMTCAPEYYKWNQWIFLQMYKRGLAYRKNAPVNWCPKDQTVLANEQVVMAVASVAVQLLFREIFINGFLRLQIMQNNYLMDTIKSIGLMKQF